MTDPASVPEADIAEFEAITDPVECARRITEYGRRRGNLPPAFAKLRIRRLIEARVRDGRKVEWLAVQLKLAPSGISRLTAPKKAATEGASA